MIYRGKVCARRHACTSSQPNSAHTYVVLGGVKGNTFLPDQNSSGPKEGSYPAAVLGNKVPINTILLPSLKQRPGPLL